MSLNSKFKAALALAVVSIASRAALADTITLHDLSQDVATGVFTYTVQLDNAANVQAGDGFVLYDFPGLLTATLTPVVGDFGITTGFETLTSNVLNQPASVDANGKVAAISNGIAFDSASIANLSVVYDGPPNPFLGAATSILTLTTSIRGGTTDSVYASIDHSGPSQGIPFSFSANPITVPAAVVPFPASFAGGAALIAGLGLLRARKARLLA